MSYVKLTSFKKMNNIPLSSNLGYSLINLQIQTGHIMKRYLPPLNSLRAFEAAARHGSFRYAAEELNVSHSAISHHIKLLESSLEVELFHREVRSVTLTERGKAYYPILRDAFENIADGTEKIREKISKNVLTIQTYITFAGWLIPRLDNFQKKHPDIQVHLNTSPFDANLGNSDADVSILMGYKTKPKTDYGYLFTSKIFPVCSPSFLQENPDLKRPEDLKPHQLLSMQNAEQDWPNWFAAAGIKEPVDTNCGIRFDSYSLALDAAKNSVGVALALRPFRMKDLRENKLIELFNINTQAYGDWYFTFREGRESNKIYKFKKWVISQVESDTDMAHDNNENNKQN